MKPPIFLGVSASTMEAAQQQRYFNQPKNPEKSKSSPLQLICCLLLVIAGFDTLFAVMMVYKNSLIIQENVLLIQQNQQLIGKVFQLSKAGPLWSFQASGDTEQFAKMVDIREECPPCTTETPTPVEPHKNPVSILNEATLGHTKYECEHVCINPPIHHSYLNITDDPALEGLSWFGIGASKSEAKQVAAYNAIHENFNDLEGEILEEHMPDLEYHPKCKTEHEGLLRERKKC